MKKLVLAITIAVISTLFFSCTKENIADEIYIQETIQATDGDWNGDTIDSDDDDDDEDSEDNGN